MLCRNTYPAGSITVYGALSRCTKKPINYMFSKSTNGADFIKFLKQVRKDIKPEFQNEEITLVCDNHSGHISHWSTARIKWKLIRFTRLLLPSNSSFLNPSERIWSRLKAIYRYRLAELRLTQRNIRLTDCQQLAYEAMESISYEVGWNLYHSATADIISFMREKLAEQKKALS